MAESKGGERQRQLVINKEWTPEEEEFYGYSPTPRKKRKATTAKQESFTVLKNKSLSFH